MRYDKVRDLTTYVISHKQNDSSVKALRNIVNVAKRKQTPSQRAKTFLEDPFSIHVLLSTLSFEASKHHVQRFQQFMWSQFNKVDDHLGGVEASDRAKLGDLTRQLQIISQNADIHDGNCNVALVTASGIRDAHARFHASVGSPPSASQRGADAIQYVIECMKKQKMWFLNYKSRKDSIMILVYNLVTQQDAANNFQIATDMKRDSTSMNSIAALTMAFLPGTFTAGVLDAGIFSSKDGSSAVQVSRIWWIWVAITVPLTVLVIRTFSAGSVPVPVRGNGSSGLV
ncbi:hypothetical protein GTA08_BOTSDO12897 [Botryosphaeria dothidea]|uniref:Uncharacterized protein n=1 Tax=Botryosphaeria dothidea TaxID=55169 RepID=A0A8H4N707_9PEZI|nr:hypothetical protein GTA08_BOTSDO14265 [Botryosphaeria dothidea]KAF4311425.1 hypothetical protein GTA08_BOTSDO12897 [Botryosphaeria dothidea]